MFDWFKSKAKEAQKTKTEEKPERLISQEEVQELIQRDLEKIKATSDEEVLAKLYEQVGVYYWQLDSVVFGKKPRIETFYGRRLQEAYATLQ